MIRKILIGLAILVIIIQFFRPSKNLSDDTSKDIGTLYNVPEDVKVILQRACNDCHSNKTIYPWYAEVQPVEWWLNDHIVDGKRHFNLNNFTSLKVAVQKKKMEECMEQIKKNEMPLDSYTWIHKDAILSEADKQTINTWCNSIIDTLKAKYPPDSLIFKEQRRRG
jgi:Haem-binding domain